MDWNHGLTVCPRSVITAQLNIIINSSLNQSHMLQIVF